MKSKVYLFDPVIYPFKLLVSKDFNSKELIDAFYCVDENEELAEASQEFAPRRRTIARTIQVADKKECQTYMMVLLCRPQVCGQGTITHESYHVVNIIADWLGFLPKSANEDEPGAYLIQWVSNCIDCVKRGHPEWMKGELYGNDTDSTESV